MKTFVTVIWVALFAFTGAALAENLCKHRYNNTIHAGRENPAYEPKFSGGIIVSTSRQLKRALKNAKNGALIVLEDGTYNIGWIEVNARIVLVGHTRWGAVITGSSILTVNGANSEIYGIRFDDGAAVSRRNSRDHSLYVKADNVIIRDNYFYNSGVASNTSDKTGITIEVLSARNTLIEYNVFEKSHGIAVKTDDATRGLIIRKNDYLNSPSFGGAGEIAHIGDALSLGQAVSPSDDRVRAKIVSNYVCRWTLESELISIKSDENTIADNFIEHSGSSAIVIRMGNKNHVQGNIMLNNTGFPVRISGENNIVEGNTFFGTGALIFLHDMIKYPEQQKNLALAYWAARKNKIRKNIYVGYANVLGLRNQYYETVGKAGHNVFEENTIYTVNPQRFLQVISTVPSKIAKFRDTDVIGGKLPLHLRKLTGN